MNHVLVVDDETEIRESLSEILREEGYTVTATATGAEALVLLRDSLYDVLLLDIWLPDRDGLDVLSEIRSLESESKPEVIIISGHGTIETAVKATKLGAFDFLEKPLSIDRTLILLKNAIDARRLRSENQEFKRQLCHAHAHHRGECAYQGAAPADPADGPDQRPGADLRRIGFRKGVDRARHPCRKPAQREGFCGAELRRHP